MKSVLEIQKEEAVELWKKLNAIKAEFEFSCGGDSMELGMLNIHTESGVIFNEDLFNYFNEEVYQVDFYTDSDGHYIGEYGVVEITLEDDDFIYIKKSRTEYNEQLEEKAIVWLTSKEEEFINKYVLNIEGAQGHETVVNYKRDFILTDRLLNIKDNLISKIQSVVNTKCFEIHTKYSHRVDEFNFYDENYRFIVPDPIEIKDGELLVEVSISVIRYEDNY